MKRNVFLTALTVLVASGAIYGFASQGQHKQGESSSEEAAQHEAMDCPMMAQMGPDHMKMMMETNVKLDDLVSEMKSATGEAKIDATAKIVETLVSERKAMHGMMMGGRMGGEGQSMMMGGAGKGKMKGGGEACPMTGNGG